MIQSAAIDKIKETELKNQLNLFINTIEEKCGENLKSVILFGGLAKQDYTYGKSNTNILFVLEKIDVNTLDILCNPFQKAILDFQLSPLLLTTSEIEPASDVFAVKLFDIQQHHILLYGEDVLKNLVFDINHLRFIAEQEVRNQLSRMKYFYIQNFNVPERLLSKIKSGITTLLINANTLIYLKKKKYYASRQEIIVHLKNESDLDYAALTELLKLKQEE